MAATGGTGKTRIAVNGRKRPGAAKAERQAPPAALAVPIPYWRTQHTRGAPQCTSLPACAWLHPPELVELDPPVREGRRHDASGRAVHQVQNVALVLLIKVGPDGAHALESRGELLPGLMGLYVGRRGSRGGGQAVRPPALLLLIIRVEVYMHAGWGRGCAGREVPREAWEAANCPPKRCCVC